MTKHDLETYATMYVNGEAIPNYGAELHHTKAANADGTPLRCRINGKLKLWKTRPDDFRLPVKYGLRTCFYITPANIHEWQIPEEART